VARADLDKPLVGQPHQCLADRGAAHGEEIGQLLLEKKRTDVELVVEHAPLQLGIGEGGAGGSGGATPLRLTLAHGLIVGVCHGAHSLLSPLL